MNGKFENTQKNDLPDLSIDEFAKLIKIFNDKNWPIDEDDDDDVFSKFRKTLQFLDKEQRHLILELTENFICVNMGKYYYHFLKAFDKYIKDIANEGNRKNIYIIPLISRGDFNKNKSSGFLYYILKSNKKKLQERYLDIVSIKLVDTTSYDMIADKTLQKFSKENARVCLIDDFMGSGNTAESAINVLYEEKNVPLNVISVVLVAAMEHGINYLKEKKVSTYSGIVCKKAITGTGYKEIERIEMMNSISERIGSEEKYYLGYEKSEALITLMRTPNNTFPIYWLKGKNKYPPFER